MPDHVPHAPTIAPRDDAARRKLTDQELIASVPLGPPLKANDLGSLGPYRVIRLIGRGGMGMVFLGVDPKLRRKVALKVMLPKFLAKPTSRERFVREARALAAVKNDHIVTIYAVEEADGTPYLALEYLLGSTLEEYVRGSDRLSISQRVHIARQVATGLAAAHEHNVIHRDIKPENIWLEAPDGRVKLIDFGLARLPATSSAATAEGTVLGTPAYMSPEQAKGQDSDSRSDLFSLGGVLYRLLAGRIPFKKETPLATVLALTNEPHVPLITENPQVPAALSDLVDRLLAKDPAARPATAKDVAKELKRIEVMLRQGETGPASDDHGSRAHPGMAIPIGAVNEENTWAGLDTDHPSATPSQSTRVTPPRDLTPFYWVGGAVLLAGVALYFALNSLTPKAVLAPVTPEPPRRTTPKASAAKPIMNDSFTPLFNGRDLAGWSVVPEGKSDRWKVTETALIGDESLGAGGLLLTDKSYSKFELRLEYRWPNLGGDAGVILFAQDASQPGLEIQLADDSDPKTIKGIRQFLGNNPKFRHGAFLSFKAPTAVNHKTSGEWNALRITATGSKISVEENGQTINDFDYVQLANRPNFKEKQPALAASSGRIGLQCQYGAVEFRNVKIKE